MTYITYFNFFMFYIRPTLVFADSTPGGVLVVSNTETEKNRNRVSELKTEPNRTGSSNPGTEPALHRTQRCHWQSLQKTTAVMGITSIAVMSSTPGLVHSASNSAN